MAAVNSVVRGDGGMTSSTTSSSNNNDGDERTRIRRHGDNDGGESSSNDDNNNLTHDIRHAQQQQQEQQHGNSVSHSHTSIHSSRQACSSNDDNHNNNLTNANIRHNDQQQHQHGNSHNSISSGSSRQALTVDTVNNNNNNPNNGIVHVSSTTSYHNPNRGNSTPFQNHSGIPFQNHSDTGVPPHPHPQSHYVHSQHPLHLPPMTPGSARNLQRHDSCATEMTERHHNRRAVGGGGPFLLSPAGTAVHTPRVRGRQERNNTHMNITNNNHTNNTHTSTGAASPTIPLNQTHSLNHSESTHSAEAQRRSSRFCGTTIRRDGTTARQTRMHDNNTIHTDVTDTDMNTDNNNTAMDMDTDIIDTDYSYCHNRHHHDNNNSNHNNNNNNSSCPSLYAPDGTRNTAHQVNDARPLLPKISFFMGDLRDGLPMINMQTTFLMSAKGYSERQVGFLYLAFGLTMFVSMPLSGYFLDSTKNKIQWVQYAALTCSMLTIATAIFALDEGHNLWVISIMKIVQGMSATLLPLGLSSISLGIVGNRGFTQQIARNKVTNHLGTALIVALGTGTVYLTYPVYTDKLGYLFVVSPIAGLATTYYLWRIKPSHVDQDAARGLIMESPTLMEYEMYPQDHPYYDYYYDQDHGHNRDCHDDNMDDDLQTRKKRRAKWIHAVSKHRAAAGAGNGMGMNTDGALLIVLAHDDDEENHHHKNDKTATRSRTMPQEASLLTLVSSGGDSTATYVPPHVMTTHAYGTHAHEHGAARRSSHSDNNTTNTTPTSTTTAASTTLILGLPVPDTAVVTTNNTSTIAVHQDTHTMVQKSSDFLRKQMDLVCASASTLTSLRHSRSTCTTEAAAAEPPPPPPPKPKAQNPLWAMLNPTLWLFTFIFFLFHMSNSAVLPLVMQTLAAVSDVNNNNNSSNHDDDDYNSYDDDKSDNSNSSGDITGILMSGTCIVVAQSLMSLMSKLCGDFSPIVGRKPLFLVGLFSLPIRCFFLWILCQLLDEIQVHDAQHNSNYSSSSNNNYYSNRNNYYNQNGGYNGGYDNHYYGNNHNNNNYYDNNNNNHDQDSLGTTYIIHGLIISTQILDAIGAGIVGTLYILVTNDISKQSGRFNLMIGVTSSSMCLGGTLSGLVGQHIRANTGYHAAFMCLGFMSLLPATLYLLFMPETLPEFANSNSNHADIDNHIDNTTGIPHSHIPIPSATSASASTVLPSATTSPLPVSLSAMSDEDDHDHDGPTSMSTSEHVLV
jgi:MFS family permease